MSVHVAYLVRRESGGKLSTSTIIIIAVVAGAVVILVFALFAWRLLVRHCRRSRTVPLPPVQDLAHHREQQLASFAERNSTRPTTWVDSQLFQPQARLYSSHFLSASGSSASLIRSSPDFTASRGPTRENSWAVEDATSETCPTPLSTESLAPPNASFNTHPHNSMTSVASSSTDGISEQNNAFPASPSEMTHSIESSVSMNSSPNGPVARPRPPRVSRSRSRPISMVSASGTMHSLQTSHSTSTVLRGPAHSIHSNIQIVLPAPLAPELYSHPLADGMNFRGGGYERTTSFYGGPGDRKSVADQWVLAGSRPQSMARLDKEASNPAPRTSLGGGPRPSYPRTRSSLSKVASTSSLGDSSNSNGGSASAMARRTRSQSQGPPSDAPMGHARVASAPSVSRASRSRTPSPSRPSLSYVTHEGPLPPVPRVPSMYGRRSTDGGPFPPYAPPADRRQSSRGGGGAAWNPPTPEYQPYPAPVPVPVLVQAAAAPRRESSSGKLRKNRASSQGRPS